MIKNYLSKAIVALTMLAGFTVTSCDKQDNALIIDGKEYYKSEVIKTEDGAIVKGNTPSDISTTLSKIKKDVAEKLDAGEDYVITIETPTPIEASKGDNTISLPIPYYDTESGAKIVLNFPNGISTEAPLQLKAKGVEENAWPDDSYSKIDINIPGASSGASLILDMPYTTVTLKAASGSLTIEDLKSITAWNTLIIEKSVTVNWLTNENYTSTIVMKGGKINGFATCSTDIWYDYIFREEGITCNAWYNDEEAEEQPSAGKNYYTQNLKVTKVLDNDGHVKVFGVIIDNDWDYDKGESLNGKGVEPNIVIEEGAIAEFNFERHGIDVEVEDENGTHWEWQDQCEPFVGSITGEGEDAKIYSGDLRTVKQLKNVTVESYNDIVLPNNAEDCVFNTDQAKDWDNFIFDIREASFDTASFTNCKFGTFESEGEPADNHVIRFQISTNEKISSFEWLLDNCEFNSQFQFAGGVWGEEKSFTITFDGSTMNGKAVTNKNLLNQLWSYDPENPQPFFNIDGKIYIPKHDDTKEPLEGWSLVEKK